LKFDNFWLSEFHNSLGKKIGFASCECIQFLNIANFHAFHVCGKRILSCNDTTFFLHFFSCFYFCNTTFIYSGYVIKPPQPSFTIYRAPPFTGHLNVITSTVVCFFALGFCNKNTNDLYTYMH